MKRTILGHNQDHCVTNYNGNKLVRSAAAVLECAVGAFYSCATFVVLQLYGLSLHGFAYKLLIRNYHRNIPCVNLWLHKADTDYVAANIHYT
ncbi:hypothetical protein [Advenella incenata]|uniref:hypothetical protein n=1 Tax=Advenella incenata TaxID=267800 RepID=UPI001029A231|nr:hypothetical protein [Advenella incenata]